MLPTGNVDSPIANLRDFGGQHLGNGRRVRHGNLYRSGSLSALSPADQVMLDQLGIEAVVDLRSIEERLNHPSEWVPATGKVVQSQIPDTKAMLREIFSGDIHDAEVCHRQFSHFYEQIPELYAAEFSEMLAFLADGNMPLLINCSAGKDRTGVAVALVLTVLGVAPSDIFADYMMTNDRLRDNPAFTQMLSGRIMSSYTALPDAARQVLMSVHLDHLNAAFSRIALDYGSVSGYIETRLSISPRMQQQIRQNLTADS
jgi:protein-tyrosine phosphatase